MAVAAQRVDDLAANAAARIFGHLEGERLIPRFIDSYIMGFDRPQVKSPPEEFRQRAQQLGREALLLLGVLVVEKCGGHFYRFKLGPFKVADRGAARLFTEVFWSALAEHLKLSRATAGELAEQAGHYGDAAVREVRFAARVAPLLDPLPKMKGNAEHAGHKFFQALDKVALQVARRVFGRS